MDFVSDCTAAGRTIRALTLVDDYTRECLAIEVDTSLGGMRVRRVLERVLEKRGKPEVIVVDNGPEFRGRALAGWSEERRVRLQFIAPGKPMQNCFIESFNGRLREECLNANWFLTLADARRKIEAWREDYNEIRPHSSLGYLAPQQFARLQHPGARQ
jgi:putative transposase